MNERMKESFSLFTKKADQQLSPFELAMALYEGTPHLQNLAEKLAQQHGEAQCICPFVLAGEEIQNFWMGIAQQLIDHSKEWMKNNGSSCVLSEKEVQRLAKLPKHPSLPKSEF